MSLNFNFLQNRVKSAYVPVILNARYQLKTLPMLPTSPPSSKVTHAHNLLVDFLWSGGPLESMSRRSNGLISSKVISPFNNWFSMHFPTVLFMLAYTKKIACSFDFELIIEWILITLFWVGFQWKGFFCWVWHAFGLSTHCFLPFSNTNLPKLDGSTTKPKYFPKTTNEKYARNSG